VHDDENTTNALPTPSRSGKRRRVTAGNLDALRREMWFAIRRVSELLDDDTASPELVIKAANALSALGNSYTRVTETAEIEAELRELRVRVDALTSTGASSISGRSSAGYGAQA
jgi:predicted RecB family endonuclease